MKFYHLWGCRWSKREARHIWRRLERDPPPIFFIVLPLDPLSHRHIKTPTHPLDRTHVLSLTLQSMLDCFAINSQCFADSRLFEIIWLFSLYQNLFQMPFNALSGTKSQASEINLMPSKIVTFFKNSLN